MKKRIYTILISTIVIVACKKQPNNTEPTLADGSGAPILPAQPYDYSDKSFSGSNQSNYEVTLGRVLFYDKNLSFNNTLSCGSCHVQSKGFADDVQFHKGVYGNTLTRNTLAITGDGSDLFWDGRSSDMSDLVLKPIANHDEMVQDLSKLSDKLSKVEYYKNLFKNAYGDETITISKINNALASFCKSIRPSQTKFDRTKFNSGKPNISALSSDEQNGFAIFNGKANCGQCHNLVNTFSYNGQMHNTGLDIDYSDNGVGTLTNSKANDGVFKSPNLRNIALTAPYMHDGRFNTLEEVVEFYNSGIQPHKNLDLILCDIDEQKLSNQFDSLSILFPDKDPEDMIDVLVTNRVPKKLNLTDEEKRNLVLFLKTLTDHNLAVDPRFSNPFKN